MDSDAAFVIAVLIAIVLGFHAVLLWPRTEPNQLPVTCENDEQCGGSIETARFCREGELYASGQQNSCVRPGKPGSECATSYEPWILADSCE